MACFDDRNIESEREEGEIVDDLDDLSDISSEEEFLLRQRLEILENYNYALERKEAKRCSIGSDSPNKNIGSLKKRNIPLYGNNDTSQPHIYRVIKNDRLIKKKKRPNVNVKEVSLKSHKKIYNFNKTPATLKIVSDTSEDSNDEEYKSKRRKLANAVSFSTNKVDNSSLKDRLAKMLHPKPESTIITQNTILTGTTIKSKCDMAKSITDTSLTNECSLIVKGTTNSIYCNNLSADNTLKTVSDKVTEDGINKTSIEKCESKDSSDEDIESLRQHALDTKSSKQHSVLPEIENAQHIGNKHAAEDEDSDTEELRIICLRSSLIKKAIEMKKKLKLEKRLSQSTITCDNILDKFEINGNTTDVENVDMDIGSDADEKDKDHCHTSILLENDKQNKKEKLEINKVEELEEDEDLLRANLLTSLSKNLPILSSIKTSNIPVETTEKHSNIHMEGSNAIIEKKFIIELGDSDSEAEHEATRNLTKMHMKLTEPAEFQVKLEQFLKSTRMQVEQGSVTPVGQQPEAVKSPNKFIPKAMIHLPKSEQIEYKRLVKRMRELEKLKESRQLMLNNANKTQEKDMLKPRNISTNAREAMEKKLEDQIAKSRKIIAEESAKMLKLKEEGKKLSQRHKIVSNELRNIITAITLNKKQQRNVQNGLNKIRLQHLMLLKSSPITHSTLNNMNLNAQNSVPTNKKQKENDPSTKDHKNANNLKSVKVSLSNDLNKEANMRPANRQLSVEVNINNNLKVIRFPKNSERTISIDTACDCKETKLLREILGNEHKTKEDRKDSCSDVNKYVSPLDALGRTERRNLRKYTMIEPVDGICVRTSQYKGPAIWNEDPNALLCPYEVDGNCRDTDCKFIHLKRR